MRTIMVALAGAGFALFAMGAAAQTPTPNPPSATAPFMTLEQWRDAINDTPKPADGCYSAHYPDLKWSSTPCTTAPKKPFGPAFGNGSPNVVGNGYDVALISKTPISRFVGGFKTNGVTSETSGGSSDSYSLQINSQFFSTPVCRGQSNCQGWQQFVYDSDYGQIFIQYWLINFIGNVNSACPNANWYEYQGSCYVNSKAVTVNNGAPIPATMLAKLRFGATVVEGGLDTLSLAYDGAVAGFSVKDSAFDLSKYWRAVEFNVFGDGGGSEADFNNGALLTVLMLVSDGNAAAPSCANDGTTGETNNFGFVQVPNTTTMAASTVVHTVTFEESVTPNGSSTGPCSATRGAAK